MKLLYYTKPFFLDCDFPYLREQKRNVDDIFTIIDLPPYFLKSTLLNISEQHPVAGIYPASIYKEFDIYRDYIDLEKTFVINRTKFKSYAFTNIILNFRLFLLVYKLKVDVIHSTVFYDIPEFLLYFFRKNTILTVHDPFPHSGENSFRKLFFRRIGFKFLNNFVLMNRKQEADFVHAYRLERKNIFRSQLGVYSVLNLFIKGSPDYSSKTILFFGRISPYKGVEYLLEAMTIVHKSFPDIKLLIIGKSNYDIDISAYKEHEYIDFQNKFVPIEKLANYISQALFTICPYVDATQSGVVMSSFALCKPVIATDVGGLSEVVENRRSGLLINAKDSDGQANAILALLNNPGLLRYMSQYIYNNWITGDESWRTISNNMLKVYQKYFK